MAEITRYHIDVIVTASTEGEFVRYEDIKHLLDPAAEPVKPDISEDGAPRLKDYVKKNTDVFVNYKPFGISKYYYYLGDMNGDKSRFLKTDFMNVVAFKFKLLGLKHKKQAVILRASSVASYKPNESFGVHFNGRCLDTKYMEKADKTLDCLWFLDDMDLSYLFFPDYRAMIGEDVGKIINRFGYHLPKFINTDSNPNYNHDFDPNKKTSHYHSELFLPTGTPRIDFDAVIPEEWFKYLV